MRCLVCEVSCIYLKEQKEWILFCLHQNECSTCYPQTSRRCLIVSKVFCKSIKIIPVNNPESNPFVDTWGKNSDIFENLIEICIRFYFSYKLIGLIEGGFFKDFGKKLKGKKLLCSF